MLVGSPRPARQSPQRGLSLVELLVGVAIGLIIVAGAATVVATQLADTRRLTVEAQIQQDLRATSDIIVRQIRRAGYWTSASSQVWVPGSSVALNPMSAASAVTSSQVTFALSGSAVTGFTLNAGPPGVVMQTYSTGPAQALTDANTESITCPVNPPPPPNSSCALYNTPFYVGLAPVTKVQAVQLSCPALCGSAPHQNRSCWPTVQPIELIISITGQSISDPNVVRTIQSTVRVRNDQICNNFNAPSACQLSAGAPLCPSLP